MRLTASDVMTVSEVAALLRVQNFDSRGIGRGAGVIPSQKIGRRRFYLRPQIEALLLADHHAEKP
jgi:hypothetical protein